MKCEFSPEELFCGAATVGERGQVVIPAEARRRFNIHPGDKIIVMGHPTGHGVLLVKIEAMREFLNSFMQGLSLAEELLAKSQGTDDAREG